MICSVTELGYCSRHQRVHLGVEAALSQRDDEAGESVRREWDKNLGELNRRYELGACRYMDDAPVRRNGCGTCPQKWEYPCEMYGTCTPNGEAAGVKKCDGCTLRRSRNVPEPDAAEPHRIILHNTLCPGDVTVMTAAIESLHRQYPGLYATAYKGTASELMHFNPNVVAADPTFVWEEIKMEYPLVNECDSRPVHFMQGYTDWLGKKLGVQLPLLVNRPRVYTSAEERGWIPQIQEITGKRQRYVLVNAGHKDDYTAKWWGTTNYQRVVDILRGRILFVQIGERHHNHPALNGVIDLRGKTDIRQLVRLVYHSAGGVGPSTFLQHLCAALDRPYTLIAGGREPVAWQHYPKQATLSTVGCVPCRPSVEGRSCWRARTRKIEDGSKHNDSLCELPVVSAGGEWVPNCLEMIRPERVAWEVETRYALTNTVR